MDVQKKNNLHRVRTGIESGLIRGWKGLIWLLKIILPISFATTLLIHFGIIQKLDFLLTPLMHLLSLPASAALAIVAGLFTGIYGTVAALSVMQFSMEHMILIAVFTLIAHNLVQESLVQGNSGINPVFAACFRFFMACMVTFVCGKIMGTSPLAGPVSDPGGLQTSNVPFVQMLGTWSLSTLKLAIQIFFIIMPLMVVLELAKIYNAIEYITRLTAPFLKIMGLDRSCGMLWLTASIFGLAYGSAVIVEETQNNEYDKEDLIKLHLSIGVNHAMIEDPALFLPLGLPPFWLWIPRLIAAMLSAWIYSVFLVLRGRHAQRTRDKKLCNHR